ncbi:MAG: AbrB/MazE/SpoVT family DNA-binding domain-containing protein [Pyrinomonadaceae bacterium]|nr:AbrB/MazE/SpoVT family DNA-binding domain-containing protein [Pyrinomonadaceae bacterium]
MYKIKTVDGIDNSVAVLIPASVLENFGISAGDEIEVTETENALILRSAKEAEKSRKIAEATEEIFDRWNNVFVALAKGVDEK